MKTTPPPGLKGSILLLSGIVVAKAPRFVLSAGPAAEVKVDQFIRLGFRAPAHLCFASKKPLSFVLQPAESPPPGVSSISFATFAS